jgi:hypothetical protein
MNMTAFQADCSDPYGICSGSSFSREAADAAFSRDPVPLLQSGSQFVRDTQGSAALTLGCPIAPLRG